MSEVAPSGPDTEPNANAAPKLAPSEPEVWAGHKHAVKLIGATEDLVHYIVIAVLLLLTGMALYQTGSSLVQHGQNIGTRVINGLNGVLFVVIVLELMSTVVAHFSHGGFQLQPFLIIGVISGVRHILAIGARLSLAGAVSAAEFRQSQIELGVESGAIIALSVALWLARLKEPAQKGE
jgi:uncharacterized membrane protein (DUF373 family)